MNVVINFYNERLLKRTFNEWVSIHNKQKKEKSLYIKALNNYKSYVQSEGLLLLLKYNDKIISMKKEYSKQNHLDIKKREAERENDLQFKYGHKFLKIYRMRKENMKKVESKYNEYINKSRLYQNDNNFIQPSNINNMFIPRINRDLYSSLDSLQYNSLEPQYSPPKYDSPPKVFDYSPPQHKSPPYQPKYNQSSPNQTKYNKSPPYQSLYNQSPPPTYNYSPPHNELPQYQYNPPITKYKPTYKINNQYQKLPKQQNNNDEIKKEIKFDLNEIIVIVRGWEKKTQKYLKNKEKYNDLINNKKYLNEFEKAEMKLLYKEIEKYKMWKEENKDKINMFKEQLDLYKTNK